MSVCPATTEEAEAQTQTSVARFLYGPANDPVHFFIPSRWSAMAPALLGLAGLLGLMSRTVPDAISISCLAVAIMICLCAPLLARIEGTLHHRDWRRYPLMALAIALPMALFGFATARWMSRFHSVGWDMTVQIYVVLFLVAIALLELRLTSIVAATLAIWSGLSIVGASPTSLLLLCAGICLGMFLIVRHDRRAEQQSERSAEREREQRRAEELLNEYEETGQGWFWETDRRGQITYVSACIAQLLGKESQELEGRPFTSLFALEARGQESERTLPFHLSTRSSFHELSVRAATDESNERWWSISGRPILDQFDNFMGFRGSGTDLTETRRSQQHVTQLARFDSLTKLANRFQMSEWLEKILNAPRLESRACAVFLLDLDRFKQVNDTMGHPAGDALLKQVAERLSSTVGDMGRVGRLGGDEFQVVLPGHLQREGLAQLAQRIIENLSQPYSIEGARVVIGASVGISLCPDDGVCSEEIIRNADLALYAAKGGGRGRHHFYDEDLHSDAKERQQLEEDLRDAIANGALELHYQPQVRTTAEKITGFEALLRWKHPEHGYISPAKFVPVAEDTGLVGQIGEWALRTACRDLANWPESVRVAVNVSPLQFASPALPAIVTSAIAAAGVSPSRIELEITESVFLGDDKGTEAMFAALKGIGVRLALDDFGTGYSSLGYLKKAPFDKIKIDQSFVRGATIEGSRNGAIIASIVSLAEALGMETTAEGVETLDELDLVRMLGCSHVQGYIYEKALTVEAASLRLAEGLTAIARGPRSARAPRQTMLRKVALEHGNHVYNGTIRNISQSGALIEGLWNVPPGTEFGVHLAEGYIVMATSRWCKEDRMGVQFAQPLELDGTGAVLFTPPRSKRERGEQAGLRKTG
ncbi:EAL domain-containing protein [Novosphingobium sp. HK4-1]|uniref:EAL domain-containing protein n=2 Tax=Novosphingobium mangrovi (ex Huang et al. 2023) TaxID=2976432 RepID=A0ABT2I6C5_9SPHN|nr:EAL domain-containing protein [Novosphingobium mangrovi (ex Huang et al. 2023)]MCT2400356.1 EAL domain-containing protein [Novosphingobium mangrovi (ex Huang et al. 2023)]